MSVITVTVVYALPESATEIELTLPAGATVSEALERSAFAAHHPEVDLARCPVGVFGRRVGRRLLFGETLLVESGAIAFLPTAIASKSIARSSPSRRTHGGGARKAAAVDAPSILRAGAH